MRARIELPNYLCCNLLHTLRVSDLVFVAKVHCSLFVVLPVANPEWNLLLVHQHVHNDLVDPTIHAIPPDCKVFVPQFVGVVVSAARAHATILAMFISRVAVTGAR